jgi:hypothetical protein
MTFSSTMKMSCKLISTELIAVEEFTMTRTSVLYDVLYCAGVAMTVACLAFVLAGNTEVLWQLEHARIPLSWVFGGVAILSFLAAEICPFPSVDSTEIEDGYFVSAECEASDS